MRFATSILAAVLAASSLASSVADACGGYFPRLPAMYLVTNHNGRAFVMLDKNVSSLEGLTWSRNFRSYDTSEVAAAPAFPTAISLTLVGSDRPRRITSTKHVLVRNTWEARAPMNALEIAPDPEQRAQIAVAGTFRSAVWSKIEQAPVSADMRAWAKSPGFSPPLDPNLLSVSKVEGTDIELVSTWSSDGIETFATTYVRYGAARPVGGYRGSAVGVVTLDGKRYLALVDDGLVLPVEI